MKFHIVTAVWNSVRFIDGYAASVMSQTEDHDVILIEDASTDGTTDMAHKYGYYNENWTCVLNHENLGVPQNHWKAIEILHSRNTDPDDVICFVDGDDQLAPRALRKLRGYYEDDTLLTYGQYQPEPASSTCSLAGPYPQDVIERRAYREHSLLGRGIPWNHLRTMRWEILSQLTEKDFQFKSGEWYRMSSDAAVMYPCLELAGDRFKFIEDILYFYNSENPLSEWRKAPREGDRVHQDVLHRQPKVPVIYDPSPQAEQLRIRRGMHS